MLPGLYLYPGDSYTATNALTVEVYLGCSQMQIVCLESLQNNVIRFGLGRDMQMPVSVFKWKILPQMPGERDSEAKKGLLVSLCEGDSRHL